MTHPLFGVVWKLDKGRSIFGVGGTPDRETREYTEIPNGYTLEVNGTKGGRDYKWGYTALYDGKDHPVIGRSDVDSIEPHKVNDRITIGIFKKNGNPVALYKRGTMEAGQLEVLTSGNDGGHAYFDVIHYTE